MATLWKTYADANAARRAVEGLTAAGVPAGNVRLLTRAPLHDVRDEPVGEIGRLADPELIVTYEQGTGRWHVAGDHVIRRTLKDAGLDDAEADRIVSALHAQRAVVVVEITEIAPARAAALLDRADRAA